MQVSVLRIRERSFGAIALAATLAATLAVGGCGSSGGTHKTAAGLRVPQKTIGYLDILSAGAYQKRNYDVFKAAVKPLGWNVKLVDAGGDPQKAESGMQSLVLQHVDAIVNSAVDASLIRPGIQAAQAAKIPVITIAGQDRPSAINSMLSGEYGENEADLAKPIAKKLVSDLKPGAKIAIFWTKFTFPAVPRHDVVLSAAKNAGLNVVADVETPFDFSAAEKKIADVLTAHPDINAMVPVFDIWMAPLIEAIKGAGLQNKIKVYGFYADTINSPLMRQNSGLVALTDGDQAKGAAIAVDQLLYHFAKGRPISKFDGAQYTYQVITRKDLPPIGQDGPVAVQDIVRPFIAKWQKDFR